MARILIADDEPVILTVFSKFLEKAGREILLARSAAEALELAVRSGPIDVALLDKNLGDRSGLEVAEELRLLDPDLAVLLVTGYASLQSAIEAVRVGAHDYLTKPVDDPAALDLKVSSAEERVRLARERRRLVAALAESEERYRSIFESSPDGILVLDPAGRVVDANRSADVLFRRQGPPRTCSLEEVLALPPVWREAEEVVAAEGRRADGSRFEAEVRRGGLCLHGEEYRTLVVRDVSARERLARERREVEEHLRQAQKMDAIGRLAGGLGHDLGNMLGVIMTYQEILLASVPEEHREDLQTAQEASERAAQLVRQLMSLARQGPGKAAPLSVNAEVGRALKLLRRSIPEDVEFETPLEPELWSTVIDPTQLAQVLINLCVNARDAMPGGGRIAIATANVRAEDPRPPGVPAGEWVLLSVADTGIGMSPEVRERIFEPFFTTKEAGKGTGLGLSVVYGIMRQVGGFVAVESAAGQGTTFRLGFQRGAAPVRTTPAPASPRLSLERQGRTVLLVEDEAALRGALAHALAGAGFEVLQGDSAESALSAARAHAGAVDLLLTDMVMPGRSGAQLAEALRRERPALKVLYMTGFPGDPRVGTLLRGPEAALVIEKPFKQSMLVEQVRRLLAS